VVVADPKIVVIGSLSQDDVDRVDVVRLPPVDHPIRHGDPAGLADQPAVCVENHAAIGLRCLGDPFVRAGPPIAVAMASIWVGVLVTLPCEESKHRP